MPAFGVQLVEEELDLLLDAVVRVFEQLADVNYLTFELEHVVQDEMSDHHEALLANVDLLVVQEHEDVLHSLVEQIWEAIEKVSKRDDYVCLDSEFDVRLDERKECVQILCTDLLRHAHELTQSQDSGSLQNAEVRSS